MRLDHLSIVSTRISIVKVLTTTQIWMRARAAVDLRDAAALERVFHSEPRP
jgi:hypothetical protein